MSATAFADHAPELAEPEPGHVTSQPARIGVLLVAIVGVGIALRVWRVGFNGLSYDESFTAMAARLPVGRLFEFLRIEDSHPPLDYLLRAPLARAGASDAVLRVPSLLFSIAALALFAWWLRDRGRVALIATSVFAISSFQILHGGEARMYALLELLGVVAVVLADRWCHRPRGWHAVAVAAVVLVALFDHTSGFLLGAGLLAVAGVGNDRAAWEWRGGVVVAGAIWLVAWGPNFLHQAQGDWAGWIPRTTVGGVATAVSGQLTDLDALAPLLLVAVLAGGYAMWKADPPLARVWLACGVVPFALAAVLGIFSSFFIDRALTVASWAPALALGFLGDLAIRRWRRVGSVAVLILLAMIAAGTVSFLSDKTYDSDLAISHLEAVVRPGDTIVTRPARYATLPEYRIGAEGGSGSSHPARTPGIDNADAFRLGPATVHGKVWLFTPVSFELSFPGYRSCARRPGIDVRPWSDGVTEIRCLVATE